MKPIGHAGDDLKLVFNHIPLVSIDIQHAKRLPLFPLLESRNEGLFV